MKRQMGGGGSARARRRSSSIWCLRGRGIEIAGYDSGTAIGLSCAVHAVTGNSFSEFRRVVGFEMGSK